MKNLISLIVLVFLLQTGRTQNIDNDFKFAVKFYNLTTVENFSRTPNDSVKYSYSYSNRKLSILHPTFAFQWNAGCGNFHEIELTNFMLGVVNEGTGDDTIITGMGGGANSTVSTYISARYEYIYNLIKSKDLDIVPSLGFGFNPYYAQNSFSPGNPSEFHTTDIYSGVKVFLTPRVTYYLSPKIFFDLNLPLCLFDFYFQSLKLEDPTLEIGERTTNTVNLNAFPKMFCLRVGFGLKL